MRRGFFGMACSCLVMQLFAQQAGAASWDSVQILPKSIAARFVKSPGDAQTIKDVFQIDWPATVAKVDGQWLQISEPGAYSNGPVEVWVRKDDITKLDDALSYCTKQINQLDPNKPKDNTAAKTPDDGKPKAKTIDEVYWLRGIYWEKNGELNSAIADYGAAVHANKDFGDAHLRLGRTLAQYASDTKDFRPTAEARSSLLRNQHSTQRRKRHS